MLTRVNRQRSEQFNERPVCLEVYTRETVMTLRFKILAAIYAMLLLYVASEGNRLFDSILDVFAGLSALFVLSVLALWPGGAQTDRVEDELGRQNWSDRVRFSKASKPREGT